MKDARFWVKEGERVRCYLCPHHCSISDMRRGICGVRENRDGKLYAMSYGKISSANLDPIEKKPLFHFRPGDLIFSVGSIGCNMRCLHCQNFTISQASLSELSIQDIMPEQLIKICKENESEGIAFTYNEPSIWHEFTYDTCKAAKEADLYTVYVTNGFVEAAPLQEIAPYLDAMNIDVKGFNDEFYSKICKAPLEPVLKTIELAYRSNIHIELTYLIIPGRNDSMSEISDFVNWVSKLDSKIPVHFTRFHPDYLMTDVPATPVSTMNMAKKEGEQAGLKFIYIGNTSVPNGEDTVCPRCGNVVIKRSGFTVINVAAKDGHCDICGEDLYMVQKKA